MICQICGKECVDTQGLTSHAFKKHGLTSKEYYDKFIKNLTKVYVQPVEKKQSLLNLVVDIENIVIILVVLQIQ